ncbi:protein RGF1 INDUCIBLE TRANSCRIPTION FACTOR 1-like [Typha latifolia]|uniref:protein RGF1 INDUCIBLE TRANSCRIPTION FACTOR 1-like n=1 Tax=Typha latifolia TaxID=4733 RepID=UPI003C2AB843
MCPHCLVPHRHHQFLQIRRYVYQDVIRILDVQRLLDLSHVQPYIVNSAKVVLLNPRRQSKPSKSNPAGSLCKICHRTVAESSWYCSIACKMSEEFDDSTVLSGSEDGCKQSEPFLENLTSDLENYAPKEVESSASSLSSLRPSDSSETDQGRPIPPPIGFRRQKGIPCRSPFF